MFSFFLYPETRRNLSGTSNAEKNTIQWSIITFPTKKYKWIGGTLHFLSIAFRLQVSVDIRSRDKSRAFRAFTEGCEGGGTYNKTFGKRTIWKTEIIYPLVVFNISSAVKTGTLDVNPSRHCLVKVIGPHKMVDPHIETMTGFRSWVIWVFVNGAIPAAIPQTCHLMQTIMINLPWILGCIFRQTHIISLVKEFQSPWTWARCLLTGTFQIELLSISPDEFIWTHGTFYFIVLSLLSPLSPFRKKSGRNPQWQSQLLVISGVHCGILWQRSRTTSWFHHKSRIGGANLVPPLCLDS